MVQFFKIATTTISALALSVFSSSVYVQTAVEGNALQNTIKKELISVLVTKLYNLIRN